MILLLSAAANRSPHVANEIERAVNYRKDIVPIRIEEVPPARSIELHLSSRQWIDLFDARRREKNMARLTDALRNRLREWLVPDLPPLPIGGGHAAETAAIASLDQPDSVGTPPADHKPTSEAIPATRSSLTLSPTPLPQSVPEVLQAVDLRLKNPSSDPGIDAAELFKQFDVQVLSELCSIVSKSQDYFGAGPINVLRFCCAQPRARQFAQGILSVLCECLKKSPPTTIAALNAIEYLPLPPREKWAGLLEHLDVATARPEILPKLVSFTPKSKAPETGLAIAQLMYFADKEARTKCLKALRDLKSKEAIPSVLDLLGTCTDPAFICEAAQLFADLNVMEAAPSVRAALEFAVSPDGNQLASIFHALHRLEGPACADFIADYLGSATESQLEQVLQMGYFREFAEARLTDAVEKIASETKNGKIKTAALQYVEQARSRQSM